MPVIRYERERPGELIHLDTKKLGRIDGIGHRITGDRTGQSNKGGTGWEFLHVAIDDASRLAYTEVLPNERKESAVAFTRRALAWFARYGVKVERIMSDNGSAYKSFAFRDLLAQRGIKHKRIKPYTPRTNGKAERFTQTSLREWAELAKVARAQARGKPAEGYAQPFANSLERARALRPWIEAYNHHRPHSALRGNPPVSRLAHQPMIASVPNPSRANASAEWAGSSLAQRCASGADCVLGMSSSLGVKVRCAT